MNLILAAGSQTRWNHGDIIGLPKVKQLVDIDGIPLIRKIQTEFADSIVVTKDPEIIAHSNKYFEPVNSEVTIATLFSTRDLWEEWTVILLGDVLYGRNTRKLIHRQKEPVMFYGDKGEIYAIKFHLSVSHLIIYAISQIVNSPDFHSRYGKLWNLYRQMNGFDFREHLIGDYFTIVSDCKDFDNKEQYLKYAKNKKVRN